MITPRERLKRAREAIGMEPDEVAREAEITLPNYYDLESDDSELFSTISLADLRDVCQVLQIQPRALFEDDPQGQEQKKDFHELAQKIGTCLDANSMEQPAFEEKVGWSLGDFLQNPDTALEWNVDCLRDICEKLRVDWLDFLP